MKLFLKMLLATLLAFALTMGCKKKVDEAQSVAPKKAGERGTSCDAKNDCGSSLSCIAGICQPANFEIGSTVKECFRVECATTAECCGEKPTDAPAKCRARDSICEPTLVGCSEDFCSDDNDCNGGGTCGGFRTCDWTGDFCSSNTDCEQDECVFSGGFGGAALGTCSLSFTSCTDSSDCTRGNDCGAGSCDCDNPNYNPGDPLCSDPDCSNVCTKVCENELCQEDNSCVDDLDCLVGDRRICEAGACVECLMDTDCDSVDSDQDDEDVCRLGTCLTPCASDSECGMFEACNAESGECEYVGCKSSRECVLTGAANELGDPRLSTCVKEDGIGVCKIECQMDAHCNLDEVCVEGACEYIGCEDDGECKSILGLHNWEVTDDVPWTPAGVCRTPVATE